MFREADGSADSFPGANPYSSRLIWIYYCKACRRRFFHGFFVAPTTRTFTLNVEGRSTSRISTASSETFLILNLRAAGDSSTADATILSGITGSLSSAKTRPMGKSHNSKTIRTLLMAISPHIDRTMYACCTRRISAH